MRDERSVPGSSRAFWASPSSLPRRTCSASLSRVTGNCALPTMPGWPLANQGGCAHKTSTSHDRQREGHCFMASPSHTKEPQYSLLFDVREKHGITRLGLMVNESWNQDPKRTL